MQVILVNGSPHPKGCTYTALAAMESIFNEEGISANHFWIENKPIGGCIACGKCADTGVCVFKDRVNEFLEVARDYAGYVFGTPVHWGASSGNLKSFMDRAFYADYNGHKDRFLFKPAACVASARRGGIVGAQDQLNRYFSLSQMPIVTSRYWDGVHGMEPADLADDKEGMQTIRILARNMAWLVKALNMAKKNGLKPPAQEEVTYTNFVH